MPELTDYQRGYLDSLAEIEAELGDRYPFMLDLLDRLEKEMFDEE